MRYKETPALRKKRVQEQKNTYTRIVPDKKNTYRRHKKHKKRDDNDFFTLSGTLV